MFVLSSLYQFRSRCSCAVSRRHETEPAPHPTCHHFTSNLLDGPTAQSTYGLPWQKLLDINRETRNWLNGLFRDWGLSGWLGSILKTVFLVLFILVVVIVVVSIVFGLIKRMVLKLISSPSLPPVIYHLEALSPPKDNMEASVENTDPPAEEEPIYHPWFGKHSAPQTQTSSF